MLEGSFRRLQTDYIDILLLHNPPRELMDGRVVAELYEELENLKAEGLIREYGVSLDWREEVELVVDTTKSKAQEVFFNALYQEPLPAFQKAQDNGVGLIIKVPLDSGWLSGRYRNGHRFDDVRSRWPAEVVARQKRARRRVCRARPRGTSMAHAALQFVLAQPQVSTVIPGAKLWNRRWITLLPQRSNLVLRLFSLCTICGNARSRRIRCHGSEEPPSKGGGFILGIAAILSIKFYEWNPD